MKSKQKMYSIISKYYNGTESKKEYCKKNQISLACMNYWITKYRKDQLPVNESAPGFIPVEIKESRSPVHSATARVELDLPYGVTIKIY